MNATPLLLLVLFNHIDIAKEVLEEKPKHIADSYGSGPYEGENCLHIAIVNRDLSFASFLCARCPALLHQRAKGSFFAAVAPHANPTRQCTIHNLQTKKSLTPFKVARALWLPHILPGLKY